MPIWIKSGNDCLLCDQIALRQYGDTWSVCGYQNGQVEESISIGGLSETKVKMIYQDILTAIAKGEKLYIFENRAERSKP